jgi:hypothetical protein
MGNQLLRAALMAVVVAGCGGLAVWAQAPLLPQISLPHVTPLAAPLAPVPGLPHVFAPQPLGPPLVFGPAPAATTVQLPTFAFFASSSTVWVPDSGGAHLGGVGRSSTGSTAYGPGSGLPNRLMDARSAATNTSVRATIHDLGELDAALLQQAGGLTGQSTATAQASTVPAPQTPALVSVAEARRQFEAQQEARQNEALHYVRQAETAVAAGNSGAARVYYQMAARRATGPLLDDIQLRLRTLNDSSSTSPNRVGPP